MTVSLTFRYNDTNSYVVMMHVLYKKQVCLLFPNSIHISYLHVPFTPLSSIIFSSMDFQHFIENYLIFLLESENFNTAIDQIFRYNYFDTRILRQMFIQK